MSPPAPPLLRRGTPRSLAWRRPAPIAPTVLLTRMATGGLLGLLVACGGGGGGSGPGSATSGVGEERPKPGGGTFFQDEHQGGNATRLRLVEATWGRLVDVHDVDAAGQPRLQPVFRDLLIRETVLSDGQNYTLETNPTTQITRLVIQRTRGAPDTGTGTFEALLGDVKSSLPAILARHDDGTSAAPFSVAPRNATLMLRFDDALADDASAASRLGATVRVQTGYPPAAPFTPRIVFDPNHGAVLGGEFHSTRLLLDMTVSEAESVDLAVPLPLNALGLPASNRASNQPNVAVRIPTRIDFGSGQFFLLTNLAGSPLSATDNGPVDSGAATLDVVRALRSGNGVDQNGGFLLDPFTPTILGNWSLVIEAAAEPPGGGQGTEFVIDARFTTPCRRAPCAGDTLQAGARFLEVTAAGAVPDADGRVPDLTVRLLGSIPLPDPNTLLGGASFLSTFDPAVGVDAGCWVNIVPQAGTPRSRTCAATPRS